MIRRTRHPFAILLVVLLLFGCDNPGSAPRVTTQQADAWEELARRVERTDRYDRKIDLLREFVEGEPPAVHLTQARGMIEEFEVAREWSDAVTRGSASVDAARQAATRGDRARAWDSPDLAKVGGVAGLHLATDFARVRGNGNLEPARTLPGGNGEVITYGSPARAELHRLRDSLRRTLSLYGKRKVDPGCHARCLNRAFDAKLTSYLGGGLFLGMGKIHGPRLDELIETMWVAPDETFLGVEARAFYDVFRELPRELMAVRLAMKEFGDERAIEAYRPIREKMRSPYDRGVMRFYHQWTRGADIALRVPGVDKATVYRPVGFWFRRMYDGSEPVVTKWLTKTLEAYDPDYLESLASSD